ncbi:MAG: hypothetical protein Q8T04_20920, partial [Bacteroidota bacterium]|nr:hypothetical protein [Bacteroidota bacterium]
MAQQETTKIKQEVEVVKAYQPTISEVEKINDIPKIKTEQTEAPVFDYSIFSKPVFSTFDVTPVAAAKMVGEPKPEMEMGLLKLGFGNYMTPYGELFFNSQPDKNSNFGMHFKHLSSYGKIGLLNGDIVKAPQSENIAEIFGEKFWRKSTLSGSLAFDRKSFNYYGYTGDMLSDELKDEMIPYYQDKQYFSKGTASIGLKGENISPLDFNYNYRLKYHYFKTKTGQTENQTVLSGDMSKKYGQIFGLLNTSLTYYLADGVMNNFSNSIGPKQQILIRINPSVMWKADAAKLQAGVNSTIVFDDDTDASMLIWPKVKAEWSPVPKILTLFVGVDGHLQHNTYSNIAAENPYADPFHDVLNTNYKYIVSGGLKGKFSSKTNYVAEASYSNVKNQHFYIIRTRDIANTIGLPITLNNTFDWVYDDLKVMKLSAEVMHSVSENFSLRLLGNYYSYELETIEKAWQMPDFDFTFSGIYKPTEQLKFTTDIFIVGKRTALILDNRQPEIYGYGRYD